MEHDELSFRCICTTFSYCLSSTSLPLPLHKTYSHPIQSEQFANQQRHFTTDNVTCAKSNWGSDHAEELEQVLLHNSKAPHRVLAYVHQKATPVQMRKKVDKQEEHSIAIHYVEETMYKVMSSLWPIAYNGKYGLSKTSLHNTKMCYVVNIHSGAFVVLFWRKRFLERYDYNFDAPFNLQESETVSRTMDRTCARERKRLIPRSASGKQRRRRLLSFFTPCVISRLPSATFNTLPMQQAQQANSVECTNKVKIDNGFYFVVDSQHAVYKEIHRYHSVQPIAIFTHPCYLSTSTTITRNVSGNNVAGVGAKETNEQEPETFASLYAEAVHLFHAHMHEYPKETERLEKEEQEEELENQTLETKTTYSHCDQEDEHKNGKHISWVDKVHENNNNNNSIEPYSLSCTSESSTWSTEEEKEIEKASIAEHALRYQYSLSQIHKATQENVQLCDLFANRQTNDKKRLTSLVDDNNDSITNQLCATRTRQREIYSSLANSHLLLTEQTQQQLTSSLVTCHRTPVLASQMTNITAAAAEQLKTHQMNKIRSLLDVGRDNLQEITPHMFAQPIIWEPEFRFTLSSLSYLPLCANDTTKANPILKQRELCSEKEQHDSYVLPGRSHNDNNCVEREGTCPETQQLYNCENKQQHHVQDDITHKELEEEEKYKSNCPFSAKLCAKSTQRTMMQWAKKFILLITSFRKHTSPLCLYECEEEEESCQNQQKLKRLQNNNAECTTRKRKRENDNTNYSNQTWNPLTKQLNKEEEQENEVLQKWWLFDQHAVHERLRLEFFLIFAEAFVLHPELEMVNKENIYFDNNNTVKSNDIIKNSDYNNINTMVNMASGYVPALSVPTLLHKLHNYDTLLTSLRRSHAKLLQQTEEWELEQVQSLPMEHIINMKENCKCKENVNIVTLQAAKVNGAYTPIPTNMIDRVTRLEFALQRWGWRFGHSPVKRVYFEGEKNDDDKFGNTNIPTRSTIINRSVHTKLELQCTFVMNWPRISVEGVECALNTLSDLQQMLDELEMHNTTTDECSNSRSNSKNSNFYAQQEKASSLLRTEYGDEGIYNALCKRARDVVPSSILSFLITRSCRGAIMFNDILSESIIKEMLSALPFVVDYYLCSHGRHSIAQLMPRETLRKRFVCYFLHSVSSDAISLLL